MEGIEYNAPASDASKKPPLRLMRFSFEPNDPLATETRAFIQKPQRSTIPIRFYASRQLLMEVPDYYKHERDLYNIGRDFALHHEPVRLAPSVRYKELSNATTRFQFVPSDQTAFDQLTSLQIPSEFYFDDDGSDEQEYFRQLPNKIENQPQFGHYLFVDIATNALIGLKERKMAAHTFVSKAAEKTLFLHTLTLSNIRDIRQSPDALDSSTEQTSLATGGLPEAS